MSNNRCSFLRRPVLLGRQSAAERAGTCTNTNISAYCWKPFKCCKIYAAARGNFGVGIPFSESEKWHPPETSEILVLNWTLTLSGEIPSNGVSEVDRERRWCCRCSWCISSAFTWWDTNAFCVTRKRRRAWPFAVVFHSNWKLVLSALWWCVNFVGQPSVL